MSKQTFEALFGARTVEPAEYDFRVLAKLMPHPFYAAQFFVCVLNPSDATFPSVRELLAEAHAIAARRSRKRAATTNDEA
ncbi:MAG: DUF6194 family protein [Verrucomicrobiota bacterium]|nr:DUF6194 family protein [Verrucomicrobiota bacterium]